MAASTPRDPLASGAFDGRTLPTDGPPTEEVLEPGTEIDHFRVMRLLGAGGMGQVYLARDIKLGRKVALKLIRLRRLGDDERAVRMFLDEARATARFNHPHIVTIYAAGEYGGQPYVALEFIEGENLQGRIAEGPMTLREALTTARAVADALVEAHRMGILHRDLKPENVVIGQDGRPRVVDFGLAHAVTGPAGEAAEGGEGGVVGTPMYMAPEAWLGEPPEAALDIWAFGAVLFQMLTGGAFYADIPHARGAMRQTLSEEAAPRVAEHVEVPPDLDGLVAQCLAKDPRLRPTAETLVTRLDGLLAGGGGPAARRGPAVSWPPRFRRAARHVLLRTRGRGGELPGAVAGAPGVAGRRTVGGGQELLSARRRAPPASRARLRSAHRSATRGGSVSRPGESARGREHIVWDERRERLDSRGG